MIVCLFTYGDVKYCFGIKNQQDREMMKGMNLKRTKIFMNSVNLLQQKKKRLKFQSSTQRQILVIIIIKQGYEQVRCNQEYVQMQQKPTQSNIQRSRVNIIFDSSFINQSIIIFMSLCNKKHLWIKEGNKKEMFQTIWINGIDVLADSFQLWLIVFNIKKIAFFIYNVDLQQQSFIIYFD
ncbi:unnamed protein product [Paramecium sonneborni]|uniref:Uncharacterized protein n=1 Tax=Paramecium sonneborni TaxID=65129 RepID=A0A8S1M709_9CILI|nr:unnamed protein product [Paramecium sonneborni]